MKEFELVDVQALQKNAKNPEHKESCRVLATGKRIFLELPRRQLHTLRDHPAPTELGCRV